MTRFRVLVERLAELTFLHRALAHVASGWIAKVPDLSIKCELARHAYEDFDTASKLSGHLYALTREPAEKCAVSRGVIEAMHAIDLSPSVDAMLITTYGIARRHLYSAYHELAAMLDPVLDANLFYVAHPAVEMLRRQLAYGQTILQSRIHAGADDYAESVEALFVSRRSAAQTTELGAAIWKPFDRVPVSSRPAGMKRAKAGSMRAIPFDSGRDPEGLALFLHNLINGEYTTMELVGRSIYEHPDMPAAFHLHFARQVADEARHARALENALAKLGKKYGDYPIYTLTYDGYYAFDPCEPGGKRELLWRMLVRGSIDEGLALDDFAFQIERREHLEQPELADLFRYLIVDETFHVQSALKWSRQLCKEDESRVLKEREAANTFVNSMLDARRREFVAAHPNEAMAELVHKRRVAAAEAKDPLPFSRTMNVPMRKAAGYSDRDLQQVVEWGYAPRP